MGARTRLQTRNINATVDDLLSRVRRGRMDFDPPYQRASRWSMEQRRALIETILLGLPIPAVVINDRNHRNWSGAERGTFGLIDGKQRLSTILSFTDGQFAVPREWFGDDMLEDPTGTSHSVLFGDLSSMGQRYITEASIPLVQTEVGSIAEEAGLYLLLNSTGATQTAEDLDRAAQIAKEA